MSRSAGGRAHGFSCSGELAGLCGIAGAAAGWSRAAVPSGSLSQGTRSGWEDCHAGAAGPELEDSAGDENSREQGATMPRESVTEKPRTGPVPKR